MSNGGFEEINISSQQNYQMSLNLNTVIERYLKNVSSTVINGSLNPLQENVEISEEYRYHRKINTPLIQRDYLNCSKFSLKTSFL